MDTSRYYITFVVSRSIHPKFILNYFKIRLGFHRGPVRVRYVVNRGTGCVADYVDVSPFSVISSIFCTHIRLNAAATRTPADKAWEPSNTVMLFRT